MGLEQRVIEITELVDGTTNLKIKCRQNDTYTLWKSDYNGEFTQYKELRDQGELMGKEFDITFEEKNYTNRQGIDTMSRNIKSIGWAKPLKELSKELQQDIPPPTTLEPPPIERVQGEPLPEKPDWDAINAKKTKDIHKQVALKIAGYNLTEVARVDFEKEPDRLNDLADVIVGFTEND